jgi:hypothetical protein
MLFALYIGVRLANFQFTMGQKSINAGANSSSVQPIQLSAQSAKYLGKNSQHKFR